ncbi:MAG: galactokinase [Clostridiales bacterium]|jgi:galactokinase|nr:galactokinase [Clostridiales bacterium]
MDFVYLKKDFARLYGNSEDSRIFFAPGRINLIGEHTDYNGGFVFPCALSFGTYAICRARKDSFVNLASANFPEKVSLDLADFSYQMADGWTNYAKGVLHELISNGYRIGGADIYVHGDIPNGAGLSSSASLELLIGVVFDTLFGCGIDRVRLVKMCQKAENQFMGINCGIMDQYAVGMGMEDMALLLDCNKVQHKYVPLKLGNNKILIANTNKRRGLADSAYNTRRAECEAAVAALRQRLDINYLCELDPDTFERNKDLINDPTVAKRAEHIVYENTRALEAVSALEAGDLLKFGQLMNASHISLRDLYDVTGAELDALAEAAWNVDGTLGSRMTGAGFGGCTVSLVNENKVDEFTQKVGAAYREQTGLTADFYVADVGGGATEL